MSRRGLAAHTSRSARFRFELPRPRLMLRPIDGSAARILASPSFEFLREPKLLPGHVAPERSLVVDLAFGNVRMTAGSFHQVTGGWPESGKAKTFRAIAQWAARQQGLCLFGIDANSPETDHPDVARNVYFGPPQDPDGQLEHLLHDPARAPHKMTDAYRTYLAAHPKIERQIRMHRPDGPLAVSHVTYPSQERRFDFIYHTAGLRPRWVSYREETRTEWLSDHALVLADFEILPTARTLVVT